MMSVWFKPGSSCNKRSVCRRSFSPQLYSSLCFNINSPFQPSKKPAPAKFSPSSSSSWSVAGSMFARVFILSLVAFLLVCVSLFLLSPSHLSRFSSIPQSFNENEEEEEQEDKEDAFIFTRLVVDVMYHLETDQ